MPVVGVIEPGVRALAQATRSGRVGVIGTVGTIGVRRLPAGRRPPLAPDVRAHVRGLPGLRRVRRAGRDAAATRSPSWPSACWRRCGTPSVDTLLLGCTHYPFLARTISDVMGRDVVLVDSADETAFEVRAPARTSSGLCAAARRRPGRAPVRCRRGDVDWFRELGSRLLGPELGGAEAVHLAS